MKWKVFYSNATESICKGFTVKASTKQGAIEKAIEKIESLYGLNDRMLSHYSITLAIS